MLAPSKAVELRNLMHGLSRACKLSRSSNSISQNGGWNNLYQRNGISVLGVAPGKGYQGKKLLD